MRKYFDKCVFQWWNDNAIVHITCNWSETLCGRDILNDTGSPDTQKVMCKTCLRVKEVNRDA